MDTWQQDGISFCSKWVRFTAGCASKACGTGSYARRTADAWHAADANAANGLREAQRLTTPILWGSVLVPKVQTFHCFNMRVSLLLYDGPHGHDGANGTNGDQTASLIVQFTAQSGRQVVFSGCLNNSAGEIV